MIEFEPKTLEERVRNAIKSCDYLSGTINEIDFDDILGEYVELDEVFTINNESRVDLDFGDHDYDAFTSLEHFLYIVENLHTATLNEKQSYAKNPHEVDFLLNMNDYKTVVFLTRLCDSENPVVEESSIGAIYWKTEMKINDIEYEVSLFRGICQYHFLVEQSGNCNKYYPAYSEDDYFIRITSENEIDMKVCDNLAKSFLFEINATHKLNIDFSDGRDDVSDEYYWDEELVNKSYEIFPLIYGAGISDIIDVYNRAQTTVEMDYKILCYTKVIEYISPTIAQEKLYDKVQLKLTSPMVLNPSSDFINELGAIYNENQKCASKDSELIRLSILTVVDIQDIWEDISSLMRQHKSKNKNDLDRQSAKECLELLSAIIYETRNEIAHAKANYNKKGNECTLNNKSQLILALDKIAVQCIRWFALQPENKRVIM